jgi:hypothetical protein
VHGRNSQSHHLAESSSSDGKLAKSKNETWHGIWAIRWTWKPPISNRCVLAFRHFVFVFFFFFFFFFFPFCSGFSGDVLIVDWKDLAYQPYFSMTASNVLFAWSHDILGPHQLPGSSNELQVRWIQWGAFSSMFRTHDRGMAEGEIFVNGVFFFFFFVSKNPGTCYDLDLCATVEVFDLPKKYFDPARQAMIERSRLLSYIYSAQRELFDTGVSLLR